MLGSQRHTKLKSSEAALLAGELTKPSWESRNEGIHERVSFEDSIWGFDLAGGAYYKTPLRVTAVKNDSRAQKAGIRPGDKLLRINDVDTSTLTIQEAHAMIIESGIHIRLAVSAPDDMEDSYFCWQDPIEEARLLEEERLRKKEEERQRQIHCRTRADWSLQWPWVSKRRIIYKESNCYMVPSKYENKHRDKFSEQKPALKQEEDIVLYSKKSESPNSTKEEFEYPKGNENGYNSINSIDVKRQGSNKVKPEKLPVPQTILEESSSDEMNNEEEFTNGNNNNITENKNSIPMEMQDEIGNELEAQNFEEKINGTNLKSKEDEELEKWNPNEKSNELEEDISEQILKELTNGHDEIQEELQNEILDEVLNDNSRESEGDMEEDITDNKLAQIVNDQDEINEESQNRVLSEVQNGDLVEDNIEEGMEEDIAEDNLEATLNGKEEEEPHKKNYDKLTNGDGEAPETLVDSVENET